MNIRNSNNERLIHSITNFRQTSNRIAINRRSNSTTRSRITCIANSQDRDLFSGLDINRGLFLHRTKHLANTKKILQQHTTQHQTRRSQRTFLIGATDLDAPVHSLDNNGRRGITVTSTLTVGPLLLTLRRPAQKISLNDGTRVCQLLESFSSRKSTIIVCYARSSRIFSTTSHIVILSQNHVIKDLLITRCPSTRDLTRTVTILTKDSTPRRREPGPGPRKRIT